jgi:hypothetical protein
MIIILGFCILSATMLARYHARHILPRSFNQFIEGPSYNGIDPGKSASLVIFIDKEDSVARAVLDYISSSADNDIYVILFSEVLEIPIGRPKTIIVDISKKNNARQKFGIPQKGNHFAYYGVDGDLIARSSISARNMGYIIGILSPAGGSSKNNDLIEKVDTLIKGRDFKDGYYYIAQSICTSCSAYRIYQDYERSCSQNDQRISIILLTTMSDIERWNLVMERGNLVEVCDSEFGLVVKRTVGEILIELGQSLIMIKKGSEIGTLIIDNKTPFEAWDKLKRRFFGVQ